MIEPLTYLTESCAWIEVAMREDEHEQGLCFIVDDLNWKKLISDDTYVRMNQRIDNHMKVQRENHENALIGFAFEFGTGVRVLAALMLAWEARDEEV